VQFEHLQLIIVVVVLIVLLYCIV